MKFTLLRSWILFVHYKIANVFQDESCQKTSMTRTEFQFPLKQSLPVKATGYQFNKFMIDKVNIILNRQACVG